LSSAEIGDRKRAAIHIGGIYASNEPSVVRTVLGSCIAVCLRDPVARVGGMNHFMLPDAHGDDAESARYGVNAMELLINRCMREGADRSRLEAKVFGGGHVLRTRNHAENVPRRNIRFAFKFLETEGIKVVSQDVGGQAARIVMFFTDTGKVLLKRLRETGNTSAQLAQIEQEEESVVVAEPMPVEDNVTLF
jgi:chemotaxis receptor (MCP) glutamine deamidase CheD